MDALERFRAEVCAKRGHTHGPAGEEACLYLTLAQLKAASVAPDGPGARQ